jgi:tripartite-type tricarboxylate transporter receptor subunit TctC
MSAAAIRVFICFFVITQYGSSIGAQEAPFKGKTVRVIVGFPAGGGADAEGRVLARHLGKYIPGSPTLIVQNMPGAGGLTASNWFEELAKPDGSTLYYCVGATAVIQQAFGLEGVKYNLRNWEMIGSVDRATSVVLLRPDKLERLTDKSKPPLGIGARTGDDTWSTIFLWGAEYLNWNVRWILGYQGGGELRVAFERGETDLYATANLVTLRELIASGFRPLTQQGSLTSTGSFRRRPEFKDVPTFDEMLGKRRPTGDGWTAYVTWTGSEAVGRPLFAPRKTPSAMVQQLRDAFSKLEGDKEFMAELKKVGGDDAELLLAKDAEPVLRQVLTVTPGVQDFVKNITKKHLQR